MEHEKLVKLLKRRLRRIITAAGYYFDSPSYNHVDIYLKRAHVKYPITRLHWDEMPHFIVCARLLKQRGHRLTKAVLSELNDAFGMCISLSCYGWSFGYGEDRGYLKPGKLDRDDLKAIFDYVNETAIIDRSPCDDEGYRSCKCKAFTEEELLSL